MEWITFQVLAIIFVATVIRSGFGFGEALVAVPLLALIMPVEVAAPLAVLVSITVAGVIIAQDWQKIEVRSVLVLVLSTLFGIPLGLLLMTTAPEGIVKAMLAVFIIGFASACLVHRALAQSFLKHVCAWGIAYRRQPTRRIAHRRCGRLAGRT